VTTQPDVVRGLLEHPSIKKLTFENRPGFVMLREFRLYCTEKPCPFNREFLCFEPQVEKVLSELRKNR